MRKRNETRKFKKIRKGSKNYSTHRNKSGGGLGTFGRYFTSDGRLLEEFKTKVRGIGGLGPLLDSPEFENADKVFYTQKIITGLRKNPSSLTELTAFIRNGDNHKRLVKILDSDMKIDRRDFYKKVLGEVTRLGDAVTGDFSMEPPPPISSVLPGPGMGDESGDDAADAAGADDVIENTIIDGAKVYKITNRRCTTDTEEGKPRYFTCDYVTEGQEISDAARCKLCFESKRKHIQQSQQGGSRRRRRTTRKNKTRRNGKCRACRCPSGCKRSTCPCYRGRSKPCCTKRCRSRGRVCRC